MGAVILVSMAKLAKLLNFSAELVLALLLTQVPLLIIERQFPETESSP